MHLYIEALLFAAEQPLKLDEIKTCLETHLETPIAEGDLTAALDTLIAKYSSDDYAFEVVAIAGGFRFCFPRFYGKLTGR